MALIEHERLMEFAKRNYPILLNDGEYAVVAFHYTNAFPGRIKALIAEVCERAHKEGKEDESTNKTGGVPPGEK